MDKYSRTGLVVASGLCEHVRQDCVRTLDTKAARWQVAPSLHTAHDLHIKGFKSARRERDQRAPPTQGKHSQGTINSSPPSVTDCTMEPTVILPH